jgi:hypothetical protein
MHSHLYLKTIKNLAKFNEISYEQRKKINNKVMLFTNARDEKNIKEWAAHHLLLGFDLIYIFDHKSKIPLKTVFSNFDQRVQVERCEMSNKIKLNLMNRASKIAKILNVDWMIYLDADEFIILNNFKNVKDLLYVFNFADQLAINWVCFGSNNHVKDPPGLILENYTKSVGKLDQHVKSFVRPSQVISATNPHFYNIMNPIRNITINKKIISPPKPFNPCNIKFNESIAYVAHYLMQSEETYKRRKTDLPSDDSGTFRGSIPSDFHKLYNSTENLHPKLKYSSNVSEFLSKFI